MFTFHITFARELKRLCKQKTKRQRSIAVLPQRNTVQTAFVRFTTCRFRTHCEIKKLQLHMWFNEHMSCWGLNCCIWHRSGSCLDEGTCDELLGAVADPCREAGVPVHDGLVGGGARFLLKWRSPHDELERQDPHSLQL